MPRTPLTPTFLPAGEAHLFRDEPGVFSILAITTTGCFAVKDSTGRVQVFNWYFRSKGARPVRIENASWLILWSCRSPKSAESAGHITRLHCENNNLITLDVRSLRRLAHLRCAHCRLTRLDLSGLTELRSLDARGNELHHADLAGCRRLERLHVSGNPRLRPSATALLAAARGEINPLPLHPKLTATSLFDL